MSSCINENFSLNTTVCTTNSHVDTFRSCYGNWNFRTIWFNPVTGPVGTCLCIMRSCPICDVHFIIFHRFFICFYHWIHIQFLLHIIEKFFHRCYTTTTVLRTSRIDIIHRTIGVAHRTKCCSIVSILLFILMIFIIICVMIPVILVTFCFFWHIILIIVLAIRTTFPFRRRQSHNSPFGIGSIHFSFIQMNFTQFQ